MLSKWKLLVGLMLVVLSISIVDAKKLDAQYYFGLDYDINLYIESEPWRGTITWNDDQDVIIDYEDKIHATFEDAKSPPYDVKFSIYANQSKIVVEKEWFYDKAAYKDPSFLRIKFPVKRAVAVDSLKSGPVYEGTEITIPLWKDIHESNGVKTVYILGALERSEQTTREQPEETQPTIPTPTKDKEASIKENVKCIFSSSDSEQECMGSSDNGPKGGCRGEKDCNVEVSGKIREKLIWKSSCGGYAYTLLDRKDELAEFSCKENNRKQESGTSELGESYKEKVSKKENVDLGCSNGCFKDNICLPFGTRLIMNKKTEGEVQPIFCDVTQNFILQKEKGETCQNNYECLSNQCIEGQCVNLAQELRETRGLLQKILDWLTNRFHT